MSRFLLREFLAKEFIADQIVAQEILIEVIPRIEMRLIFFAQRDAFHTFIEFE